MSGKEWMRWVSEFEFKLVINTKLERMPHFRAVTGPGRSGAIAAVYASHILGCPFVPMNSPGPRSDLPMLIIDTARESGRTLRKAARKYPNNAVVAVYEEPPRVKFWYER